ncbi:fructosamine kinase [Nesterenkonia natronophila]|uniref:Fructosamine kinase n=1 Tax=Nesterenkonia natronophila TaxID=2174932 RepID=A0A3A4F3A5_9MICC|nr:fructosamine kinase [Nesterenkonia natronophila]
MKRTRSHPHAAEVEAAGLRWLRSAEQAGGPRIVKVLRTAPSALYLQRIAPGRANESDAVAFGAALAKMHCAVWPPETFAAENRSPVPFGALPPDHPAGTPPLFGPADELLELGAGRHPSWGVFHATERLEPVLAALHGAVAPMDLRTLRRAQDRIGSGVFDCAEPASLIHGDLWNGNALWSDSGVVLIDPAAHTGHREADLAMLQLFGLPHLDAVLHSYQQTAPLTDGWRNRVPIHQLFYLAVHLLLFGPGYRDATMAAAETTLQLGN